MKPRRSHQLFDNKFEPYLSHTQQIHGKKKLQPSVIYRPKRRQLPQGKFDGKTSYKQHYPRRERSISPSPVRRKNQSSIAPVSNDRYLQTTYGKSFTKKSGPYQRFKGKTANPNGRFFGDGNPSDFNTTYTKDYVPKELKAA